MLQIEARARGLTSVQFRAMGSPCELLVDSTDLDQVRGMGELAAAEARRIEAKFSRYLDDSVVAQIHRSRGAGIDVDPETAHLLDFAAQCYSMSDGLFDITSGVLRRAWKFDGSHGVPDAALIESLLPLIGWSKVTWQSPHLVLPPGMEIDFGGIGKEYAVDRTFNLLNVANSPAYLVNFGGDLRTNRPHRHGQWQVGVERPGDPDHPAMILDLGRGALATSGDSRRFVLGANAQRYGHVLDPRTGWPVPGAPRSVTVAASSCTEAGTLSTLALLAGSGAREFLQAQEVKFWIVD